MINSFCFNFVSPSESKVQCVWFSITVFPGKTFISCSENSLCLGKYKMMTLDVNFQMLKIRK